MNGFDRKLNELRAAGDRDRFRQLVDAVAHGMPFDNLRNCLPGIRREDAGILAELPEDQLLIRPCFPYEGAVLTVRGDEALETLTTLGPELGPGIVRLVLVPGLGREHLADLLHALPLRRLRSLRMEGNDVRCQQASVKYGDDNVVHLRIDGDDRILQAVSRLPMLEDLRLANNRLSSAGATALASMTRVKKLDVSGNPLGNAGAFRLARGLPMLRELRAARCEIGDRGAAELCDRDGLDVLDLRDNPISDHERFRRHEHALFA
ncbi:MAG: hypothetical protein GY913_24415 [Proteobacteria bacterium]|nr:hypothetical protein [Pseudomonadota bacterium]MCP4920058.1 hypothetical protein [Pseudomonadota bacterium]